MRRIKHIALLSNEKKKNGKKNKKFKTVIEKKNGKKNDGTEKKVPL